MPAQSVTSQPLTPVVPAVVVPIVALDFDKMKEPDGSGFLVTADGLLKRPAVSFNSGGELYVLTSKGYVAADGYISLMNEKN